MATDTKQAKNTWITNESGQKTFWARANAAGLDKSNAHELFSVESMYEYPGSLADAIKTIENWQATQRPPLESQPPVQPPPPAPEPAADPEQAAGQARALFEASQVLPEAGALAWTKVQSKAGYVWSVTVRAGLPPDEARTALRQVTEQIMLFENGAKAMGWLPVSNGHEITHDRAPAQSPAPPAVPATGAVPPVAGSTPPTAGGDGNGDLSFDAETLVISTSGDKTYYRVKGGKYSVHGVVIWPEVLTEAGFNVDQLDTRKAYQLTGYVARYILNENGNPKKVTALVKAS